MSPVKAASTSKVLARTVLYTAVLLSACASEVPMSFVTQRDSAGIAIVESTAPAWGDSDAWTIDPEPVLDLSRSGSGPRHQFYRVGDATRFGDGSIAVTDRGSHEVRFFSPTGEFVRAVGRDGEGPGEFRGLTSIDRYRGDSLVAFDIALERATVFPVAGGEPRVVRFALPFVLHVSPLENGSLVGMLAWPSVEIAEGEPGLIRHPVPVVRFSASGDVIDTLVMSAGHEEVRIAGEYGFSSARPLFAKQSHVTTAGASIYLGSADSMQYEVYADAGRLERIVRIPNYNLSLTSAEVDAERRTRMGDDPTHRLRSHTAELPDPQSRPAYSKLIVDSEMCLWAAEHIGEFIGMLSSDPQHWEVFDDAGRWLGRVASPARFTVFEIGPDYVLGVQRDELDVEHVRMYRLNKP